MTSERFLNSLCYNCGKAVRDCNCPERIKSRNKRDYYRQIRKESKARRRRIGLVGAGVGGAIGGVIAAIIAAVIAAMTAGSVGALEIIACLICGSIAGMALANPLVERFGYMTWPLQDLSKAQKVWLTTAAAGVVLAGGILAFIVVRKGPAQRREPEDPLITQGTLYRRLNRIADAEMKYKEALAKNPQDAAGYLGLGKAAIVKRAYDEAVSYLQKAIKYDPTFAEAHHHLGVVYHNQGQIALAIESAENALAIEPHWAPYELLGECYLQQKAFQKAEAAFLESLEIAPDNKEVNFKLAALYEGTSQLDKAETVYRAITHRYPNDLNGYTGQGRIYAAMGKMPWTIAAYRSALALATSYEQRRPIYFRLARLYNEAGDFAQALQTCEKLSAIMLEPPDDDPTAARRIRGNRARLYVNWGRAYLGLNDYANAAHALRLAVNLQPRIATHRYRLGLAYLGGENYEAAVAAFGQALSLKPAFANASLKLASAYLAMGKPSEARSECRKVLERSGLETEQRVEAYKLSGLAYRAVGDVEAARRQLIEGLSLQPNNAEIQKILDKL